MTYSYDRKPIQHARNPVQLSPTRKKALILLEDLLSEGSRDFISLRSAFRRHNLTDEDLYFAGQTLVHEYERRIFDQEKWLLKRHADMESQRVVVNREEYQRGREIEAAKGYGNLDKKSGYRKEHKDEGRIMPKEGRAPIPKKYISRRKDRRFWDGKKE